MKMQKSINIKVTLSTKDCFCVYALKKKKKSLSEHQAHDDDEVFAKPKPRGKRSCCLCFVALSEVK